jgi:hypothetical protein
MLIAIVLSGPIGRLGISRALFGLILSGRWSRAIEWRGVLADRDDGGVVWRAPISSGSRHPLLLSPAIGRPPFVLARLFLFCLSRGYSIRIFQQHF